MLHVALEVRPHIKQEIVVILLKSEGHLNVFPAKLKAVNGGAPKMCLTCVFLIEVVSAISKPA